MSPVVESGSIRGSGFGRRSKSWCVPDCDTKTPNKTLHLTAVKFVVSISHQLSALQVSLVVRPQRLSRWGGSRTSTPEQVRRLVVAVIVGLATQSFWGGVIAFVLLVGVLAALRIIR